MTIPASALSKLLKGLLKLLNFGGGEMVTEYKVAAREP